MHDVGLTHVAFVAADIGRSIAFYGRYAGMQVVHDREDGGARVVWLSDRTRPFVLVLIGAPERAPLRRALARLLGWIAPPFAHLGVGVESRAEVDRLAAEARREGVLALSPRDYGPPVGYFAFVRDPDGHTLEVSHGQEVGLTVKDSAER